jgi:hypothetical protein
MASGSSAGFTINPESLKPLPIYDVKLAGDKAQKRAWVESTCFAEAYHHLYKMKPKESAAASEKMENGKATAIYGVDPYHYVINTYATKGFEERLHLIQGMEKGASGAAAINLENKGAVITANTRVECTMLDYADFNRHHTPLAQAIIFDEFAREGTVVGVSIDWVRANIWVREAKTNMWMTAPESKQHLKVFQGMFSGTRSTDLINTLLNKAYFDVANTYVEKVLHKLPINLYHQISPLSL